MTPNPNAPNPATGTGAATSGTSTATGGLKPPVAFEPAKDAPKEPVAAAPKAAAPKVNPFETATTFLLHHVIRHGDGVAAPAAQKHLEAITAAQADPASPHFVPPPSPKPLFVPPPPKSEV